MIKIAHLYPVEMNIYGDTGNRLVLEKRLEWRGLQYKSILVGMGDNIPHDVDIIIGGGGQDAGQQLVERDLSKKAPALRQMAKDGVVMIMVCGMYQLFGEAFVTNTGAVIEGAGILPVRTKAGTARIVGNIIVSTPNGELVGYENHSGRTYLEGGCMPIGTVRRGTGNNDKDMTEGARIHNVFGTYMHGPLLSKNPHFADELLKLATKNDFLTPLNDDLELRAHIIASKRPR